MCMAMDNIDQKRACINCSFLMISESSETNYRCGFDYFKLPPFKRKVIRITMYKPVEPDYRCSKYKPHSPFILRDKGL